MWLLTTRRRFDSFLAYQQTIFGQTIVQNIEINLSVFDLESLKQEGLVSLLRCMRDYADNQWPFSEGIITEVQFVVSISSVLGDVQNTVVVQVPDGVALPEQFRDKLYAEKERLVEAITRQ